MNYVTNRHIFMCCSDIQEIKTKPGVDVTLPCESPRRAAIKMFKWIRPDLKSQGYVYSFRHGHPNYDSQHESFRGRVTPINREINNRHMSVILNNVNINDAGKYECHVGYGGTTHHRIHIITLTVEPGERVRVLLCLLHSGG